ncbi:MAG: hypothetical protein JO054_13500, partial [Actinobacteria bacterium]|nr:hypothetical protein [Actinomycetota bacterium]
SGTRAVAPGTRAVATGAAPVEHHHHDAPAERGRQLLEDLPAALT